MEAPTNPELLTSDLVYAVAGKVAEFYPQASPRDMEKNHRLARAILRLPALRDQIQHIIAAQANKQQTS
jgi:hypothetical protein